MFNNEMILSTLSYVLFKEHDEYLASAVTDIILKSAATQDLSVTGKYAVVHAGLIYCTHPGMVLGDVINYIDLEEEDVSTLDLLHESIEGNKRDKIALKNFIWNFTNSCTNWADISYLFPKEAMIILLPNAPANPKPSKIAKLFRDQDHYLKKAVAFKKFIDRRNIDILMMQSMK